MKYCIVVPWHDYKQMYSFMDAWRLSPNLPPPDCLILQQDPGWKSCAKTKNAGINAAMSAGAEFIIILDSDCYPSTDAMTLESFAEAHIKALEPQPVKMFQQVTTPPSRGTPYFNRTITMPVAASMGYWTNVPDLDAPGQLVHGQRAKLQFNQSAIFGRHFPLCGMNLAFRVSEFPWCQFIDVSRFDDIFSGFLWQRHAYSEGKCFNLNGPMVSHSRQSNVFQNLRDESLNLERNESIWHEIATGPLLEYSEMLKLHKLSL